MPSTGEDLFNTIFICYTLKHGYTPESMDTLYTCIYMYGRATYGHLKTGSCTFGTRKKQGHATHSQLQ